MQDHDFQCIYKQKHWLCNFGRSHYNIRLTNHKSLETSSVLNARIREIWTNKDQQILHWKPIINGKIRNEKFLSKILASIQLKALFNNVLILKEHCTQKKIWIHLMQNIFRNQTVKNLTILDNPFKRYDFSKFSLNSVKSLCRPHKLATVPCYGCTTPHWFCTQIITNFQFSWIWVKLLIKLILKSIQIHISPKQTWLISRENLLFTWELYF